MITEAGKYNGKISDYGYGETDDGKAFVDVWFDIEGKGSVKWRGFLTEKAMERTFKSLITCGLTGPLAQVAEGPLSGALNMKNEVSLVIEMKPGFKDPSKKFANVKFINAIGGSKFDAAVQAQGKNKLAALEGALLKVKSTVPAPKETAPPPF